MVGMLVTMVCIVVLFAILMNSVNFSVTGQGTQQAGTVRSFEDKMSLLNMYQWMMADANENKGQYLSPSRLMGGKDVTVNTTANFFSAMVMAMEQPAFCQQLRSGNEYSQYVVVKTDYNMAAYDAAARRFWDPTFVADLQDYSNVSFAHMPLFGERLEKQWRTTMQGTFPLLGNRGPKDGVNNVNSYACGRDGVWRGHVVFGDGHIDFIESPLLSGLTTTSEGASKPDNLFIMEGGPRGSDAILSFTKTMTGNGPELQFD